MTRNVRTLSIGLTAMLAFSALAASSASATDVFTTSAGESDTISGIATNGVVEITSPALSAQCATVKLHGVVENGAAEGTGDAAFEGTVGVSHEGHCGSALGAFSIDANGCEVIITGNTNESGHAEAWVECENENEIEMEATELGVTLSVPAQTPTSGGLTYTNENGKVKAEATVEGITYTCSPAFLCGLGGIPTEANNADLTGSVTVSGANGDIAYSES